MIEWGTTQGDGMTLTAADTSGTDDFLTSTILDGVKRMLLRLAEAQERLVATELESSPDSCCPEAVEGYHTTAFVLREVAAALGTSAMAA
jgi:hypothetical protein